MNQAPIALFVHRRPECTRRVLQAIRACRPRSIYIFADGPSPDSPVERERCEAVREVVESYRQPAPVMRNYAEQRRGIRKQFVTGLDTVFEHHDRVIVLEDDQIPNPTFFTYCQHLLDRYENDHRVFSIAGNRYHPVKLRDGASFFASRYFFSGAWATWKSRWKCCEPDMKRLMTEADMDFLWRVFTDSRAIQYWSLKFQQTRDGADSLAQMLTYHCFRHGWLNLVPAHHLVENIGFNADATHTRNVNSPLGTLPVAPLTFPINHPTTLERNTGWDDAVEDFLFSGNLRRAMHMIQQRHR